MRLPEVPRENGGIKNVPPTVIREEKSSASAPSLDLNGSGNVNNVLRGKPDVRGIGLPSIESSVVATDFVPSELSRYMQGNTWWDMSEGINERLMDGSGTVDEAAQIIKDSDSVRTSYPLLEVPKEFQVERPDILFTATTLRYYKPREISTSDGLKPYNPWGELYSRLSDSELKDLKITNLDELKHAWQIALPLVNTPDINPIHAKSVLSQLTFGTYLANLELHRLTANPDGVAIRFSRNEYEHVDPSRLEAYGPWFGTLPDSVQKVAEGRELTYWYRFDARGEQRVYSGRTPIMKTIRELEAGHFLALDPAEGSALTVIAK
jgi:hypothetical protein